MLSRRASIVGSAFPVRSFTPITWQYGIVRSLQRHYLEDKETSQRALVAMLRLRGVPDDDEDLERHVKRLHIIRSELVKLREDGAPK
jgi:hypothetical protein